MPEKVYDDEWGFDDSLKDDEVVCKNRRNKDYIFKKDHGEFITYKINHKFKFNKTQKARGSGGCTIVCQQWQDSPYKIVFSKLSYRLEKGKASRIGSLKEIPRYILTFKGGRLNLYKSIFDPINQIKKLVNISNNPKLINNLGIEKIAQVERVVKVLNIFFKQNNIKHRILYKGLTLYNLDEKLIKIFYPGAKNLNFENLSIYKLDGQFSKFLRQPIGIKELIRKCFGCAGSKLTKMVLDKIKNGSFDCFRAGLTLKGLIPIDYYESIIFNPNFKKNFRWGFESGPPKLVRRFLRNFSKSRILSLVKEQEDCNFTLYIKDTVKIWNDHYQEINIPKELKSWKELHDYIYKESVKLSSKPREIKYKEEWAKIDGAELENGIKIILPKITTDLIEWGANLHFCLGASHYQKSAADGEELLFAIYKQEVLSYCIQVTYNRIIQFRGKHNSAPNETDYKIVFDYLRYEDIIKHDEIEIKPYLAAPIENKQDIICVNCRFWRKIGPFFPGFYEGENDFPSLVGECMIQNKETEENDNCESFEGKEDKWV